MSRSAEPSTVSQIITEERDAVPLIGQHSGETGSDRIARALARERGGPSHLTEEDQELLAGIRAAERRRAIQSAPWHEASLLQLTSNRYDLPKAVVDPGWHWCSISELLPPSLSPEQVAELDEDIEAYESDMIAAGPEATAVILRRLAACVIVPDRGDDADMAIAMECYLEDLQGYPEHILVDVTKEWRRTQKFWPTIAEVSERCHKHEYSVGRLGADLKKLYLLRAIANNPAPDTLVTRRWMVEREHERDCMVRRFDRFKPRERIENDETPKLALAS